MRLWGYIKTFAYNITEHRINPSNKVNVICLGSVNLPSGTRNDEVKYVLLWGLPITKLTVSNLVIIQYGIASTVLISNSATSSNRPYMAGFMAKSRYDKYRLMVPFCTLQWYFRLVCSRQGYSGWTAPAQNTIHGSSKPSLRATKAYH